MKSKTRIPLPFIIPYENGTRIVSKYENDEYLSIKINQLTLYYKVDEQKEYDEDKQTELEITYISDNDIYPKEDLTRMIFYKCYNYTNEFLSALRFAIDYNHIRNLTISDLPDYLTIEINDELCLYITSPMKLKKENTRINKEQAKQVINTLTTWENYPQYSLTERFYSKAKNSIESEDFISAIIELQTSMEIFIRNSMKVILTIEGENENKTKELINNDINKMEKTYFKNVIEHHLSKKLETPLDFDENTIVKKWNNNLYQIRNEIVHSGKITVDSSEVYKAFDSYVEFRNYIADKMLEKKFLSKDGMVNLRFFKETYSTNENEEEVIKKLRQLQLIPEDIVIK